VSDKCLCLQSLLSVVILSQLPRWTKTDPFRCGFVPLPVRTWSLFPVPLCLDCVCDVQTVKVILWEFQVCVGPFCSHLWGSLTPPWLETLARLPEDRRAGGKRRPVDTWHAPRLPDTSSSHTVHAPVSGGAPYGTGRHTCCSGWGLKCAFLGSSR